MTRLSIDPDERLVQMPAPWRKRPVMNGPFPDRGGEPRTKAVPPVPKRLAADTDAPLEPEILDLSPRQRMAVIRARISAAIRQGR
jgi:hypothetical protein